MRLHGLPTLETARLVLRPFDLAESGEVQRLAGAWEVAATTANILHPCEDGMAEAWIRGQGEAFAAGEAVTLAVTRREAGELMGAIGLHIDRANHSAELGYWIGVPFWNQGFCTEAAGAVVRYGFRILELHRICARHMTNNPASGRVLQKLGMTTKGGCDNRSCGGDGSRTLSSTGSCMTSTSPTEGMTPRNESGPPKRAAFVCRGKVSGQGSGGLVRQRFGLTLSDPRPAARAPPSGTVRPDFDLRLVA